MPITPAPFNAFTQRGLIGTLPREQGRENALAVSETTDAAPNTGTTYSMSSGDSFNGALGFQGDSDWVAIELTAGVTYTITMTAGTMSDPFLSLHFPSGTTATANDDANGGTLNSQIVYTPSFTGTYYVAANSYENIYSTGIVDTGTYSLSVTGGSTPPPAGSPLDAITWGYTAPSVINVYFVPGGVTFDDPFGAPQTTSDWSAAEQAQAMLAFGQYENIANVAFNVVTDPNQADFMMVESTDPNSALGYWGVGGTPVTIDGTSYNNLDGHGVFYGGDSSWSTSGLQQGGYGFVTLIHEIGHGMGLAHPHDRGGSSSVMNGVTSAFGDLGDFNLNQGIYTTMSYNDGWQTAPQGPSTATGYGYQGTPMAFDIAVIQSLYGANMSHNVGNNVYVLPDTNTSGTYYSSIWDAGGTDAIGYAGNNDVTIDLREAPLTYAANGGGYVSYATGVHGGFTIANGAEIEIGVGGNGNDQITGNGVTNLLLGNGGNDTISGGAGIDVLNGGTGINTLTGGADADIFVFIPGDGTMNITDFNPGEDIFAFKGLASGVSFANLAPLMSQDGADVVIAGGVIRFENTLLADLDAGDFAFV